MSYRVGSFAAGLLFFVLSTAAAAGPSLVVLPIELSPRQPATGDEVGPVKLTVRNDGDAASAPCGAVLGVSGLYAPALACPTAGGLVGLPVAGAGRGKAWRWSVPALAPGASVTFVFAPVAPASSAMFPIKVRWQPSAYAFLFLVDGGASAARCVGPAPRGSPWPVTDVRAALGALVAGPAGEPRPGRDEHHRPRWRHDQGRDGRRTFHGRGRGHGSYAVGATTALTEPAAR